MITCALVNSKGNGLTVAGTQGSMVGHGPANARSGQVHRTAASDREEESTSSTAEESAQSSPSIRNCYPLPRSVPCRLFIASSDQSQEPRCVICGFDELDHSRRRHGPPAEYGQARVVNGSGQRRILPQRRASAEQSLTSGILHDRRFSSDLNIFDDGTPKCGGKIAATPTAWRNSYDVRGEYLTKEDFRAKYSNFFSTQAPSSFDNSHRSCDNEVGSSRKFYYHPSSISSVYYYTDRGRINDSGGDTDTEQQSQQDRPVATYWSDSETVKQSAIVGGGPFPLITFKPLAPAGFAQHYHSTYFDFSFTNPLPTESMNSKASYTVTTQPPITHPRCSTLLDYKVINGNSGPPENLKHKSNKKITSVRVSFHTQTSIIGHDGGAEHFLHGYSSDSSSSTLDDEADDGDAIWARESKTEFEIITEINTEFNADRRNFVSEERNGNADAAVLVSVTVTPPQAVSTTVAATNGVHSANGIGSAPVLERFASAHTDAIGQDSDPVYAPIRKSVPSPATEFDSATRKAELDEKLRRMARDLNACRISGPTPKVKGQAPLPPVMSASLTGLISGHRSGGIKKSQSTLAVPGPSPAQINSKTASANGLRRNSEVETVLHRTISHDRCSSIDVPSSAQSDDSQSSTIGKAAANRQQSRSRFSSIRKFLRMSDSNSNPIVGSVRRSHYDSSSTNCSTISCSSSSNGSISFGHHSGLHASLRKFPLLPFVMNGTKSRSDLNTVRGLFHGASECRAADEIAQDTDVIVTDINELPSANNTLVRTSKHICAYEMPSHKPNGGPENIARKSNGFEHPSPGCHLNPVKHNVEATSDRPSVYINRLEVNGHGDKIQAAPSLLTTRLPLSSLPPRPPPLATSSLASNTKIKRAAPGIPSPTNESDGPQKLNGDSATESQAGIFSESADNSAETVVWRLATKVAVQSTSTPDPQPKTVLSTLMSSQSNNLSTAVSAESVKRSSIDDRYDQLVAGHLSALSHLVENFPSTTRQCRRKLSNLGVDRTKLRWSDFNVVANTPLLVTETSALYAGVLKLENKPESQSLKVDLMITPLRYNNPLPTSPNQHRSYFPPVVAEFQEYIPAKLVKLSGDDEDDDSGPEDNSGHQSTLCKILVLPRMMVSNIESYADHTSSRHRPQKQPFLHEKEVCFIMIQLVSSLKYLQSKGVEDINADLDGFLLFRTVSSRYPQLVICCESFSSDHVASSRSAKKTDDNEKLSSGRRSRITLCQGALAALCQLLHTEVPTEELVRERRVPTFNRLTSYTEGFQKAADMLHAEKPHSLTQAKSLLEYMFWVDSEHQSLEKQFDSEQQARWWLDRERARFVCHAMKALLYFPVDGTSENSNAKSVNSPVSKLDIVDEYRAQFLLHATAKYLADAATSLDNGNQVHVEEIML